MRHGGFTLHGMRLDGLILRFYNGSMPGMMV